MVTSEKYIKNQIKKQLLDRVGILPAKSNKELFFEWMQKIKNKYLHDNELMMNAFDKIIEDGN